MPFDGADFPIRPRRREPGGRLATVIIVALTSCLLIIPVSLAALGDIVRYLARP